MSQAQTSEVMHNQEAARFELRVQGQLAFAQYQLIDGVMWLTHTETPPALRGHGLAAQVVRAALDHARTHGLRVRPACSYVRAYLRRHPEAQDLGSVDI
ncbi:MAG TPA: GNAT family N-acetyltransferase [Burkholderiaceae bacterium]|nr:GNAT family N-acetyltransferase [Burkholderiaceae bacterium]